MTSARIPAIDCIKAAAIVAVVVTHAGPPATLPETTAWESFVRVTLSTFHVPAFLAVSGFLYRTSGVLAGTDLRQRLFRILVPYVIASAAALAIGIASFPGLPDLAFQMATASVLGIYYFVFALAVSVLVTSALTRLSPVLPEIVLAGLVVLWLFRAAFVEPPERRVLPDFWAARDVTRFYVYFVAGWVVRGHWSVIRETVLAHRATAVLLAVVGIAVHFTMWMELRVTNLVVLARAMYTASVVGLIATTSLARYGWSFVVRTLSDSSYAIYLYHLFFVLPLGPLVADTPSPVRLATLTAAGVAGPMAITWAARRLLGERSRIWIGA